MAPKTFIVTGASRGLGLGVVQALLRASHKVFLVARSEKDLKQLKDQHPSSVDFLAVDLADFSVCYHVFFSRPEKPMWRGNDMLCVLDI